MKEDILEQLVEDWLQAQGYFTRANLKFRPVEGSEGYDAKLDRVPSDIDVIGIHPGKEGSERVYVVNCKSWQDGFEIQKTARKLRENPNAMLGGKEYWKHFREFSMPRWTDAFLAALRGLTHCEQFTHFTAVTLACDPQNKADWEENEMFGRAMQGNPVRFITLPEMLGHVFSRLGTSVESSPFSRTLQLFKAAGLDVTLKPKANRKGSWNGK